MAIIDCEIIWNDAPRISAKNKDKSFIFLVTCKQISAAKEHFVGQKNVAFCLKNPIQRKALMNSFSYFYKLKESQKHLPPKTK